MRKSEAKPSHPEHDRELADFLLKRGFNYEAPSAIDSETAIATYWRTGRGQLAPDCLCNDRPSSIRIVEYFTRLSDRKFHSSEMGICGETGLGWVKFHFYGLKTAEIQQSLDALTAALYAAWTAVFDKGNGNEAGDDVA